MFDNLEIVKTGTALYAGVTPYKVRIVKSPIRYGSGDYEDPQEVRDDVEQEYYYAQFESLIEKNCYNIGGGGGSTLDEAMSAVERRTNRTVCWDV